LLQQFIATNVMLATWKNFSKLAVMLDFLLKQNQAKLNWLKFVRLRFSKLTFQKLNKLFIILLMSRLVAKTYFIMKVEKSICV